MAKKNSLGRGLDSLFLENDETDKSAVNLLRVSEIEPNPTQPRKNFDMEALALLADSIARHGLLQPIAVRENESGFYRIIAGERRWRAAKMAGLTEIPAIIYDMDDQKAAELALIENIQREDLNPIEEARAFSDLIRKFGMTQEDLSGRIGRSRSAIANAIRLLELPDSVLERVADGSLSAGHARAILSLDDEDDMVLLAERVLARSLSVRDTENAAKEMNAARRAAEDAEEQAEAEASAEDENRAKMLDSYFRALERRVSDTLGHRFRILDAGNGKAKKIEITYSENDELEDLLRRLCGDRFLEESQI